MKVTYTGLNALGDRTYDVAGAVVTAVDEDAWAYLCSKCQSTNCKHVSAVMFERDAFETADAEMGDPNP